MAGVPEGAEGGAVAVGLAFAIGAVVGAPEQLALFVGGRRGGAEVVVVVVGDVGFSGLAQPAQEQQAGAEGIDPGTHGDLLV
ncbi:hypothetical protein D3C85_1573950 [compost metagenome]